MENIEENTEETVIMESTPMGRVWVIVFLSMCVTFALSWWWHMHGMSLEFSHNTAARAAVIAHTEEVARYRDLLKEKGKVAAEASLITR